MEIDEANVLVFNIVLKKLEFAFQLFRLVD